jgi:hypothetical protein
MTQNRVEAPQKKKLENFTNKVRDISVFMWIDSANECFTRRCICFAARMGLGLASLRLCAVVFMLCTAQSLLRWIVDVLLGYGVTTGYLNHQIH